MSVYASLLRHSIKSYLAKVDRSCQILGVDTFSDPVSWPFWTLQAVSKCPQNHYAGILHLFRMRSKRIFVLNRTPLPPISNSQIEFGIFLPSVPFLNFSKFFAKLSSS